MSYQSQSRAADVAPRASVLSRLAEPTALGAIVFLAGLVRLYRIDSPSFSLDEVWSIWMAQRAPIDIARSILFEGADNSPPTYYLLARAILVATADPLALRWFSAAVGILVVALTFRLGLDLVGRDVALVASLLIAIAPLQVLYSQTARGYVLAGLFGLLGVILFGRLVFLAGGRKTWLGLVAVTIGGLYVHPVSLSLLVFENLAVFVLWLAGHARPTDIRRWLLAQIAIGLCLLPLAVMVLRASRGHGLDWLGRPDVTALGKSALLFATGDPSPGADGPTAARLFGLAVALALVLLGIWTWVARRHQVGGASETRRLVFLVCAGLIPWAAIVLLGEVRPIYKEKYLLFLQPLLMVAFAWVIVRARQRLPAAGLGALLVGTTFAALSGYQIDPPSEQWREAATLVRASLANGDSVVVEPGFYVRPVAYYAFGEIGEQLAEVSRAPSVKVEAGDALALGRPETTYAEALGSSQRVWLISSGRYRHDRDDPALEQWLALWFVARRDVVFAGPRVRLWERTPVGAQPSAAEEPDR